MVRTTVAVTTMAGATCRSPLLHPTGGQDPAAGAFVGVPTAKEQGVDVVWPIIRGFYVGPKVSDADYKTWTDTFAKAMAGPAYDKLRNDRGLYPFAMTGAEFETVLLEETGEDVPSSGDKSGSGVDEHGGYARILKYRNTVVEIEVHARRPGYLVLNDAFHPWWRATVDGEESPIMKANLLFRAVSVPEGNHRIRFEFKPVDGSISELATILFRRDDE